LNRRWFGEADSRFGCLPLPLTGYFLRFFCKCAEDTDVTVADDDCLLRRSGVAFFTLTNFNPLDKQVQKLTGQLVNLSVAFGFIDEPGYIGDGSLQLFDPFNSLRNTLLQAVLFAILVSG